MTAFIVGIVFGALIAGVGIAAFVLRVAHQWRPR